MRNLSAVSAAKYSNQVHAHASGSGAFGRSFDNGGDDSFGIEPVRLSHEEGTETQLQVIDAFALRVLYVFARDAPAGLGVGKHASHPKHLRDECHHAGLALGDLHMRPQFLGRRSRQLHSMLFRQV